MLAASLGQMLGKKNLIPSSESHQHLAFLSRTWTLNKLKTSKGGRETIVARGSRKRLVPRTRFSQLAGSGLPNSVQSTPTSKPRLACHKQGVTRLYAFAGYYRWQPQLRRGHYPADTTTATATRPNQNQYNSGLRQLLAMHVTIWICGFLKPRP